MKYLYSVVFSAIMAVIAPLGFSALIIDSEPVIIPNIGFTALAQLSPAEAKEYLKDPNNYEELTGIRKYIHFTFTDNEYLPYVLAFPFIIAFVSAMFGIWVDCVVCVHNETIMSLTVVRSDAVATAPAPHI